MTVDIFWDLFLNLLGGLAIFLLGMKNMSEGMQAVAGNRLRRLISAITNNRLMATGVGTLVTTIIQSSSVTTVMVVGFVNSGFMTLTQALGVIFGANIGTTITGWILVLKVGKYGLLLLGAGGFVFLFSKRERVRYTAMAIMGVGMIFFGLELMSQGLKPIREIDAFVRAFSWFKADSYFGVLKCALAGCLLTMIVQSSSATLGITMALASTGVIGFVDAAAFVLGENIGTTITALLASIGTTTNAKRAAYGHTLFNIIGVFWITAAFRIYIWAVVLVLGMFGVDPYQPDQVKTGIAVVHSGFNIINTLIFLPFLPLMAQLLMRIVPERRRKEVPHLTQLDHRLLESPIIGIEQSRVELLRMGDGVAKMMDNLKMVLTNDEPDEAMVKEIFRAEEVMDVMQKEITIFLSDFMAGRLPHRYTEEGRLQLRMADEYESVSDYITNIIKSYLRIRNQQFNLSDQERQAIMKLHDAITGYIGLVNTALAERDLDVLIRAKPEGDAITHKVRELRDTHIRQLSEQRVEPLVSSSYSDMLNSYRRVKDHTLNVAEALAGQK